MNVKVRVRHETVNLRLKRCGILKQTCRQNFKNKEILHYIVVITQLDIDNGINLHMVKY